MAEPTITAERIVSMGHRLPHYEGICASPHGHNVRVVASIYTRGAFLDFKAVSATLGAILEDFDHAMVLSVEDPLLPVLRSFRFRTVALSVDPTTEAIAQWIFNQLTVKHYTVEFVRVHETDKYAAVATAFDGEVVRCDTR